MDQKTLMLFIERIVLHSEYMKALVTLEQLETLFNQQGDCVSAALVKEARASIPEVTNAAKTGALTPAILADCERRAKAREERERMMRAQSRC